MKKFVVAVSFVIATACEPIGEPVHDTDGVPQVRSVQIQGMDCLYVEAPYRGGLTCDWSQRGGRK